MSYDYLEKLRDPCWQKRRFEILFRDAFACQKCGETRRLHVHHKKYVSGKEPWDYPDKLLTTLCEFCHEKEHEGHGLHEMVEALTSKMSMSWK